MNTFGFNGMGNALRGNGETVQKGSVTFTKTYSSYTWAELATVTFDKAFPSVPKVVISVVDNSGDTLQILQPRNITTSGFTLYGYCISEATVTDATINYIAIG